jgi:hypothetical protein
VYSDEGWNSFHSTNKSLDNISMGEMADGFDGVQR